MDKKSRVLNICAFVTAVVICMVAAVVCCYKKQAMHEDEFYSYYSSNRTYGLIAEGCVSRDTVMDELTVRSGEGFNFSLVKEVQSWDVHPPLYYFVLHFVSSLTPGVFSKWQGLIINLVCLFIALLLMKRLGGLLMPDHPVVVDIVCLAWGISAATLTGVVFIRMYMLLTVWILAVTILHVSKKTVWFWPVLGVLTFLGFMTHYYFFIWLFFLAVAWNIRELIITRKIKTTLIYGLTMIITFGLCYLFYPAFPAQMFRGQRGAQATGNFFDLGNTWERICFFAEKVNRIGFGRALFLIIPLVVLCVILSKRGRDIYDPSCSATRPRKRVLTVLAARDIYVLPPLFAAFTLYFVVVSKTALILGDSSIRYQMPVLGIVYLCIFAWLGKLLDKAKEGSGLKRHGSTILCVLAAVLIILNIYTDLTGNISFLYREKTERIKVLSEFPDAEVYYVCSSGQPWIVWADMTELLIFDKVNYVFSEKYDGIPAGSDTPVILYIEKGITVTDATGLKLLFSNAYTDSYIVN